MYQATGQYWPIVSAWCHSAHATVRVLCRSVRIARGQPLSAELKSSPATPGTRFARASTPSCPRWDRHRDLGLENRRGLSGLTESMALAMTCCCTRFGPITPLADRHGGAAMADFRGGFGEPTIIFGAALQTAFRHLPRPQALKALHHRRASSCSCRVTGFGRMRHALDSAVVLPKRTIVPGWLVWQRSSIVGIYLGPWRPPGV